MKAVEALKRVAPLLDARALPIIADGLVIATRSAPAVVHIGDGDPDRAVAHCARANTRSQLHVLAQFYRGGRARWVIVAFLASCGVLLILSLGLALLPPDRVPRLRRGAPCEALLLPR
jgi:hypothetical protein